MGAKPVENSLRPPLIEYDMMYTYTIFIKVVFLKYTMVKMGYYE